MIGDRLKVAVVGKGQEIQVNLYKLSTLWVDDSLLKMLVGFDEESWSGAWMCCYITFWVFRSNGWMIAEAGGPWVVRREQEKCQGQLYGRVDTLWWRNFVRTFGAWFCRLLCRERVMK